MGSAALLVPMIAVPESRVQIGEAGTAPQATAHVNFKIVIPEVLYLHVEGVNSRELQTNAWLTASVRTHTSGGDAAPPHGNVVLNAAAHKIIAQDTACTLSEPRAGRASAVATQLVCTASMP